jgi:hypothetical protein
MIRNKTSIFWEMLLSVILSKAKQNVDLFSGWWHGGGVESTGKFSAIITVTMFKAK